MKSIDPIIEEDVKNLINKDLELFKNLEGKVVLVTGANGMIGSYFLHTAYILNRDFFDNRCKVYSYIHHDLEENDNLYYLRNDPNFEFIKKDLTEKIDFPKGINYFIHTASLPSSDIHLKSPIKTINLDVFCTNQVLEEMKDSGATFLYLSSCEIYGYPSEEFIPIPETYLPIVNHLTPRSCYVESKRFGETLCFNYFKKYGCDVRLVRPSNVFGPGFKSNDKRICASLIKDIIEDKDLEILGDGLSSRGFCYIADGILQMWYVLLKGKKGEVYNIGSPDEKKLSEVAKTICNFSNKKFKILNKVKSTEDPKRSCPDMSKLFNEFSIKNYYSFEEGIKRTLTWAHRKFKKEHYESETRKISGGLSNL